MSLLSPPQPLEGGTCRPWPWGCGWVARWRALRLPAATLWFEWYQAANDLLAANQSDVDGRRFRDPLPRGFPAGRGGGSDGGNEGRRQTGGAAQGAGRAERRVRGWARAAGAASALVEVPACPSIYWRWRARWQLALSFLIFSLILCDSMCMLLV